jgi:plastocyanin
MTRTIALLLVSASLLQAGTITGAVKVVPARDSSNAVVYLDKIPNKVFEPPQKPLVLDQINLTFVPHVLPVLSGTTVAFPNSDEVRHNVFSPSPPKRFNLGTYPRGVTRTVTFDKPGDVALLCNVHAEMSAYVIVVETPYFAVTGKDGSFTIPGVPPGEHTVKAWHEKAKPAIVKVTVKGEEEVALNLVLK